MAKYKSRRRQTRRDLSPDPAPAAIEPSTKKVLSHRRLKGWRKWLMRLALLVLGPGLFFAVLEGTLRCVGYGFDSQFLIPAEKAGLYKANSRFTARFFGRDIVRLPSSCRVIAPKQQGVYRIVLLGESAAHGLPDEKFNFGRILQVMLEDAYPDIAFELVNGTVTGINSHVILPIAHACAQFQPDLFVVYMGNNEVIGPFGPGSVFGKFTPSLGLVRANIWVKSWRFGQLVQSVIELGGAKTNPGLWGGLAMFTHSKVTADDPALNVVYEHFRQNLSDICRVGTTAGAKVVVCTVASNLRDFPPFASLHARELQNADLQRWENAYHQAIEFSQLDRHTQAVECYEQALAIDDRYAEAHYRLARSLLAQQQNERAAEHFSLARDLDSLRFRADSRINQIVRDTLATLNSPDVALADVAKVFASDQFLTAPRATPDQATGSTHSTTTIIPGNDMFYEHVHLRFEGNYRIARVLFDHVIRMLPPSIGNRDGGAIVPQSLELCAARLGYTDVTRLFSVSNMAGTVRGPPFSDQLGAVERLAELRREELELKRKLTPDALQLCVRTIKNAMQSHPEDVRLRLVMSQAHIQQMNWDAALSELQAVLQVWPDDPGAMLKFAIVSDRMGDAVGAEQYYRRLVRELPTNDTYSALADFLLEHHRANEALAIVNELLGQHEDLNLRSKRALILAGTDSLAAAEREYRAILDRAPRFVDALVGLASILISRGELFEAESYAQRALLEDRTSYDANMLLATLKIQQNLPAKAIPYAQAIIAANADESGANLLIARLRVQQGNHAEAIPHLREEIRIAPNLAAQQLLAWLLATSRNATVRNGTEAVTLATGLSQQAGPDPRILVTLAAAYAENGRYADAQTMARDALQRAEAAQEHALTQVITKQLELYQLNQPWRE